MKENNKSAYETAYNDYNRQNNISNNPISKKVIFEVQNSNKTSKNRRVPISAPAKKLLLEHRMKSTFTEPTDFVICTKNRKPTTAKNADDTIKAIQKNSGTKVQGASTHTLRHTCASLLFKAGIPIEMICQILGNSREVCEKTYVHFAEQQMKAAASKAGSMLTESLNKLDSTTKIVSEEIQQSKLI